MSSRDVQQDRRGQVGYGDRLYMHKRAVDRSSSPRWVKKLAVADWQGARRQSGGEGLVQRQYFDIIRAAGTDT